MKYKKFKDPPAGITGLQKNKSFHASSSFTNENRVKISDFPIMYSKNVFIPAGFGTTVKVEISFTNEADLKQIIDMGFEAGFSATLGNLEELLEKNV